MQIAFIVLQVRGLVHIIIPLRDVNTVEKTDGNGSSNTQNKAMVVTTRGKVSLKYYTVTMAVSCL